MQVLLKPVYVLWRCWFYLMMALPILLFFPILLVFTLRESWYRFFYKAMRIWAGFVMLSCGFIPQRRDGVFYHKNSSFMFVGNHTSMLDIFMMLHTVKNPFVFVGKKELTSIPIFGFFYKRVSILVDRESNKSKVAVYERAQRKIKMGYSICIFPEGGVPADESIVLDRFKDGAFRLAINHQLPIVPLVFPDHKKRFSYTFFSGSPGKCQSFILPKINTTGKVSEEKNELKEKVHHQIYEKLMQLQTA